MNLITTRVYAFNAKDDSNKSKETQFPKIEFVSTDFEHLSENCFYAAHFKSCFLIKARFFIPDPDDDSHPGQMEIRIYLIEPVFEIIGNRKTKFLRVTLLNDVSHFTKVFDYLDFLSLDDLGHGNNILHWTTSIVINHILEQEHIDKKKITTLQYRLGDYRETIMVKLKEKFTEEEIQKMRIDFANSFATEIMPQTKYSSDSEDLGYSKDELDDMYRAAYENDPSNQWNND